MYNSNRDSSQPTFESKFLESLRGCMDLLNSRMEQLEWKGRKVRCFQDGNERNIQSILEQFVDIDTSCFNMEMFKGTRQGISLDRKHFLHSEDFQSFWRNHVRCHPYAFQIKKISNCDCALCLRGIIKEPKMPSFSELNWLPLPIVDKKERSDDDELHYFHFDELLGLEPVAKDQPSLKPSQPSKVSSGKRGRRVLQYGANRVRKCIQCSSCGKWRCIYVPNSRDNLTAVEKAYLEFVINSGDYVCGAVLATEERSQEILENDAIEAEQFKFFMQGNLTCETKMESESFLSSRLNCNRDLRMCSYCGLADNTLATISEQERKQFDEVFPPCIPCQREKQAISIHGNKRRVKCRSGEGEGCAPQSGETQETWEVTIEPETVDGVSNEHTVT